MINLKSIKTQLIIFLSSFALYLSIKDRETAFLLATFVAVISAVGVDSLILYLKNKKFVVTENSIISGLIVGYVLSSDNTWGIFVLASLLAIFSKHLIHIKKKHLFNPAAFGIFSVIILFGASTQWRGTYAWYILIPFGLYFIQKIRKLEILLSYTVVSLILFGVQACIQKAPFLNIFGYLSYFYIFIMLIEPKTTPINSIGKIIFGALTAILIFILTEISARFDVELLSLLVSNLTVPVLNKLSDNKRRGL